jgi:hypothetical protein
MSERDELMTDLRECENVVARLSQQFRDLGTYAEQFRRWVTDGLLVLDRAMDFERARLVDLRERLEALDRGEAGDR